MKSIFTIMLIAFSFMLAAQIEMEARPFVDLRTEFDETETSVGLDGVLIVNPQSNANLELSTGYRTKFHLDGMNVLGHEFRAGAGIVLRLGSWPLFLTGGFDYLVDSYRYRYESGRVELWSKGFRYQQGIRFILNKKMMAETQFYIRPDIEGLAFRVAYII